MVAFYPLGIFVLIVFIFADNWPLIMQLLEEGEVVEDHSGQAQFTNALTDQVGNAMWHKVCEIVSKCNVQQYSVANIIR